MITKRKLFSIVSIILVIFLLFQGINIYRNQFNDFDNNKNFIDTGLDALMSWKPETQSINKEGTAWHQALFIGDETSDEYRTIQEWAGYTKSTVDPAASVPGRTDKNLIFIQGSRIAEKDIEALDSLADEDHTIIFTSMPSVSFITTHQELQKLFGISEIRSEDTELTGMHLYAGFLTGGEYIYEAHTKEEEKKQDLNLNIPWYITGSGTETYMNGLFSAADTQALDPKYPTELLPAVIWKSKQKTASIFLSIGDYFKTAQTGAGMIDAMLAQAYSYAIYPVVNAQEISIFTYPTLGEENENKIESIYRRSMLQLQEELIYPQLEGLGISENVKMTFHAAPYVFTGGNSDLESDVMETFLKYTNEISGEMGLSGLNDPDFSNAEKMNQYLIEEKLNYAFHEAVLNTDQLNQLDNLKQKDLYKDLTTVETQYDPSRHMIAWLDNDTTLRQITAETADFTYSDHIRLLCTETALAYSNLSMDLTPVFAAENDDDQWQIISKRMFASLSTYEKPFKSYESTTASQADAKIRRFLTMDYSDRRNDDEITLKVMNAAQPVNFILRTNQEEVKDIEGGKIQEIEKGTYLITAAEGKVKIKVAKADQMNISDKNEQEADK